MESTDKGKKYTVVETYESDTNPDMIGSGKTYAKTPVTYKGQIDALF